MTLKNVACEFWGLNEKNFFLMNENEEVILGEDDKNNVVMTADKYFETAAAGSKSGSQKVAVLHLYSNVYQSDLAKAFKQ